LVQFAKGKIEASDIDIDASMSTNYEISPAKLHVSLKGQDTWDKWYSYVQLAARNDRVWQYTDPTNPVETYPQRPQAPAIPDEQPTDWALKRYEHEYQEYRKAEKVYEEQEKALRHLYTKIYTSVDSRYYMYFKTSPTPYTALKTLKHHFSPSTEGRERDIRREYQAVLAKKIGNIEQWIADFIKVYEEALEYQLPDVQGTRALLDLLTATKAVTPSFSSQLRTNVLLGEKYEMIYVVDKLREAARYERQPEKGASHSAFAGQKADDTESKGTKKPCICGFIHRWFDCLYLNKAKKPFKGFKPNQRTKQELFDKLKADPQLADKVKAVIQRGGGTPNPEVFNVISAESKDTEESDLGAFTVSAYSATQGYKLLNHWILDSGADIHITNTRNDFEETSKALEDDKLVAGGAVYPITCFGTSKIHVQTKDGKASLRLLNVAYVPGFMSNLVSLSKLVEKGCHWNTQTGYITHQGKELCSVHKYHGHWTLTMPDNGTQGEKSAYATYKRTSLTTPIRKSTAQVWHRILGHPSQEALRHLPYSAEGVQFTESLNKEICESCKLAKSTEIVSRRTTHEIPAKGPFERISWDLIPMEIGYNGDQYVSHFKCTYTGFNHVYTQSNKKVTLQVIEQYLKWITTQHKATVKFIRLDGETSLGQDFTDLAKKEGFSIERSAPGTQAQNGHAERAGRTIMTMARSMRIEAGLPSNLWPELVKTAGYYLNRMPHKALQWKTPFEAVHSHKPSLAHIRLLGCKAYMLDKHVPKLKKLDPRAQIGYLIGYQSTNLWRIWDPRTESIKVMRDVTFNESSLYEPDQPPRQALLEAHPHGPIDLPYDEGVFLDEEMPLGDTIEVTTRMNTLPPLSQIAAPLPKENEQPRGALPTPEQTPDPEPAVVPPINESNETEASHSSGIDYIDIARSHEASDIDTIAIDEGSKQRSTNEGPDTTIDAVTEGGAADHAAAPPHESPILPKERKKGERDPIYIEYILPEGTKRERKPRRQAYIAACEKAKQGSLDAYYSAFSVQGSMPPEKLHQNELPLEPRNWREMQRHRFQKDFTIAAYKEWDALQEKDTFIEEDLTAKSRNALPLTWVFKYKLDEDGYLAKFKARICVRGDLQVSHEENYAATLAAGSFRALMALAAAYDMEIKQVDAMNAFLNSDIDEEVYIQYPPGMERANKVLRLIRALYGLKRSPLLWYRELTSTLRDLGLEEINGMNCVMAGNAVIVFFYVDDIILLYDKAKAEQVNELLAKLQAKYPLRVIPKANWFLGVRIVRNRQTRQIWLCQDSYIDKISAKFHHTGGKAITTPLPVQRLLPNEDQATAEDILLFQRMIGSINFATCMTRPDTGYATSSLSQNLLNPSDSHLAAARRVIGYLANTRTHALQLTGQQEMDLCVYTDASFADLSNRKSSQGYLICLGDNVIDWKASKQKTVTTSSTEAELLALSDGASEAMRWERSLAHLKAYLPANRERINLSTEIKLLCDNSQTIRLLTKPTAELVTKLRHVDVHNHWLREKVQDDYIKVDWVKTNNMRADGLTKALSADKHTDFMKAVGLQCIDIDASN